MIPLITLNYHQMMDSYSKREYMLKLDRLFSNVNVITKEDTKAESYFSLEACSFIKNIVILFY